LESIMTPYLFVVLAGYAAFVAVLGFEWLRNYAADLRQAAARPAASLEAGEQRRPDKVRKAA
jgi:hypothetical protein